MQPLIVMLSVVGHHTGLLRQEVWRARLRQTSPVSFVFCCGHWQNSHSQPESGYCISLPGIVANVNALQKGFWLCSKERYVIPVQVSQWRAYVPIFSILLKPLTCMLAGEIGVQFSN